MIQFDKRLPVYEQIIDYVKKQIVSGEWELGRELPSRREFASQLQVRILFKGHFEKWRRWG